jgi:RNA recognition motif-containing protein
MESKLYVGNLPYDVTEDDLRGLFAQAGEVKEVALITDRATGRSKGFGFVEMATQADAEKAIQTLNNHDLGGRALKVTMARPREERGGGAGYRGGGGRRGGRGEQRGGQP